MLSCLYNTANSNTPNADLIKTYQQFQLFNTFKEHNKDSDPDKHLKSTLNRSGSVNNLEDDFNHMILDNNCISNCSLLHINARCLCKNLNKITSYLDCLKTINTQLLRYLKLGQKIATIIVNYPGLQSCYD